MVQSMVRVTRLGLLGKIHRIVLHLIDNPYSVGDTADRRIDVAAHALQRAERSWLKSTRVHNIEKAIVSAGTGGSGSAEEVVYEPESVEDFRDLLHLQHQILASRSYRADLRAIGSPDHFERFFRESLVRCFHVKCAHQSLIHFVVGPSDRPKPVGEFTVVEIDQIIDGSPEQIAKNFGYSGPTR